MEVIWSRAADRDLGRIYAFFEAHSTHAARHVLRRIFQAIDSLSELPRMGKVAEFELDKEYRELVVDQFKIYYFLEGTQLVISRLWDTRQDPRKFFIPRS